MKDEPTPDAVVNFVFNGEDLTPEEQAVLDEIKRDLEQQVMEIYAAVRAEVDAGEDVSVEPGPEA